MSEQTLQNQLDRLHRRSLMTVAPIKITATNDDDAIHRVQGRVNGTPEVIDNIGVMQIYGLASHAMVGTDATGLFVGGQRSNVVVIATGNQQYRLRGLKPGEVALYTDEGDYVRLNRGKIVEIKAQEELKIITKKLTIEAEDKIEIKTKKIAIGPADGDPTEIDIQGNIQLDGNLNATGSINAPQGHVGS